MGYNWRNANAIDVIKAIQNNSDILTSNTKPRYRITLTPETMKDIKSYNSRTDYLDMSLNCQDNLRCTSNFIKGNYTVIQDKPDIEENPYVDAGRLASDDYAPKGSGRYKDKDGKMHREK